MKQEYDNYDNYENLKFKISSYYETSSSVDPLVKLEEEEEKTRLKRRLRLQVTRESTQSEVRDDASICSTNSVEELQVSERMNDNLYCKTCNYTYNSTEVYLSHQIQIHRDELPENYCNFCDKYFKLVKNYELHMDNFHNCKHGYDCYDSCKKNYKTRGSYRAHIDNLNDIESKRTNKCPNKTLDTYDQSLYCNICDYTLTSKSSYRQHLKRKHAFTQDSQKQMAYSGKTPDTYNLNSSSGSCQRENSCTTVGYSHLLKIHSINHPLYQAQLNASSIIPIIGFQRNYCNLCRHTYGSEYVYRLHLFNIHNVSVEIPLRKTKIDSSIISDINNVNNY